MAGNLQYYASAQVYLNGKFLVEEARVNVKRTAAGTQVSVGMAVPLEGFEFDGGEAIKTKAVKTITVFAGHLFLTLIGTVVSDEFHHAVAAVSLYTFRIDGGFSDWKMVSEEQIAQLKKKDFINMTGVEWNAKQMKKLEEMKARQVPKR